MKTVFETSFALEKLLRLYGYTRLEPRFSISALGTTINVFSSNNHDPENNLVLEALPPYYNYFQFSRMDRQDEIDANKHFFEHFGKFVIVLKKTGFTICACIFHGGGSGQIPDDFDSKTQAKPFKYTQEQPDEVTEFFKFRMLTKKLPELEGIFD